MSIDEQQLQRNMKLLAKILRRASAPAFWGRIELFIENGKLRDHFKIETTVKGKKHSTREIDEHLDVVFPSEADCPQISKS